MLKPSLQLKLGQQLTMTPQLQQAIRLLQLPALELQAHIRELLETNVMLEPTEEAESTGTFEVQVTAAEHSQPAERAAESRVEVLEESWSEHGAGPAETPWSGDDEERQQEYADASGQSLQDRSEEHTSELQSRLHLVCRLLLEKKKKMMTENKNVRTLHARLEKLL